MPHLEMSHSSNLGDYLDIGRLCAKANTVMCSLPIFEVGGIRVRAESRTHYAIADCDPRNAFLDAVLRIGTGRSESEKRDAGDAIFGVLLEFTEPLLNEPYFALSLEIREIDPVFSWKKNSIHARLRNS